jgi:hypothetical protein
MVFVMQIRDHRFQARSEMSVRFQPLGQGTCLPRLTCRADHDVLLGFQDDRFDFRQFGDLPAHNLRGRDRRFLPVGASAFQSRAGGSDEFCEVGGWLAFNAATSASNWRTRSINGRIRAISSSRDQSCNWSGFGRVIVHCITPAQAKSREQLQIT